MASFSDTFPTDGDSPGAGWTEQASCDMDVISGSLRTMAASFADHCAARTDTSLAADQYVKVTFLDPGSGSNFPRIYFRYTDSSSPHYVVTFTGASGVVEWERFASIGGASETVQSGDHGAANSYRTFGVTIEGTGTDTVIRVWVSPTNNTPTNISNWDSGSDPADLSFTNNPTSAVDSGIRAGLGGVSSIAEGCRFDDVYGGDFAAGRTALNTRSNSLGVDVGMGWRMSN